MFIAAAVILAAGCTSDTASLPVDAGAGDDAHDGNDGRAVPAGHGVRDASGVAQPGRRQCGSGECRYGEWPACAPTWDLVTSRYGCDPAAALYRCGDYRVVMSSYDSIKALLIAQAEIFYDDSGALVGERDTASGHVYCEWYAGTLTSAPGGPCTLLPRSCPPTEESDAGKACWPSRCLGPGGICWPSGVCLDEPDSGACPAGSKATTRCDDMRPRGCALQTCRFSGP